MEYTIYSLTCPITKEIKYIGSTRCNIKRRLLGHLSDKKHKEKSIWINNLKNNQLKPIIKTIEIVNEKNVKIRERSWIEKMDKNGIILFNKNLPPNHDGSKIMVTVKFSEKATKIIRHRKSLYKKKGINVSLAFIINQLIEEIK